MVKIFFIVPLIVAIVANARWGLSCIRHEAFCFWFCDYQPYRRCSSRSYGILRRIHSRSSWQFESHEGNRISGPLVDLMILMIHGNLMQICATIRDFTCTSSKIIYSVSSQRSFVEFLHQFSTSSPPASILWGFSFLFLPCLMVSKAFWKFLVSRSLT